MVWITLLVSIVVGIFTVSSEAIGDFYMEGEKTDTNYHKLQMDREYREALTGRPSASRCWRKCVRHMRKFLQMFLDMQERKNMKNMRVHTVQYLVL